MNRPSTIRLVALLFLICTFCITSFAQDWRHIYGTSSSFSRFEAVVVLASGDYAYAGTIASTSTSGSDTYLVKTDPQGNIIWEQTFNLGTSTNRAYSLIETSSGNLAMAGVSDYPNSDVAFILTDAAGILIFSKTFGGSLGESATDVIQTADGGFAIAAGTRSFTNGSEDFYLIKIDALGNLEWAKNYGTGFREIPYGIHQLSGGDYLIAGNQGYQSNDNGYVVRVAPNGDEVWKQAIAGLSYCRATTLTANDELLIAGRNAGSSYTYVKKIDANGNLLWTSDVLDTPLWSSYSSDIIAVSGGFVVAGNANTAGGGVTSSKAFLSKIDANGQHLWTQLFGHGNGENFYGIAENSNGDLIGAGYTYSFNPGLSSDSYAVQVNANGELSSHFIQGQLINDLNLDCILDAGETGVGDLLIQAVSNNDPTRIYYDITDANGNFNIAVDTGTYLFSIYSDFSGDWEFCQPFASDNFGGIVDVGQKLVGFHLPPPPDLYCFGSVVLDTSGNCMKEVEEPRLQGWIIEALSSDRLDTFRFTSGANGFYSAFFPPKDTYKVYLVPPIPSDWVYCVDTMLVDSTLIAMTSGEEHDFFVQFGTPPGAISGQVFFDDNDNCLLDGAEIGLQSWEVSISPVGSTFDTVLTTNAMGNFDWSFLPVGDYEIRLISNSGSPWVACQDTQVVSVFSDSITTLEFALQAVVLCPQLTVDVSTPLLRNCQNNIYYVHYCNEGTDIALNAEIDLELDDDLSYISSSIPLTSQSGNVLTFDLGDIAVGQCSSFQVTIALSCNAIVGQTHCVEAYIFPDSLCVPSDPAWDGSSIALSAYCENDSVFFNIANVGTGDMTQHQGFIVIEDNVLIRSDVIQLPAGWDTTLNAMPRGATLRLEVEQSPAHPGMSFPSVAVEGCGINANGTISLGYVTQYPEDDADPFVSIDCQESVGSYDPNIKRGYPKGITAGHFIEANSDIEYHLHFQNTGTDTAFLVILEDTLSSFLDPLSIQTGASSHPYTFELIGSNLARFTFTNIQLPDSSTNAEASMGFVKFRIAQQADNPAGSVINNEAAIYFDNNAAVITNTTTHRIPEPLQQRNTDLAICEGDLYGELPIMGDTVLVETIDYVYFDSLLMTQIASLPTATSYVDTSLQNGGLYHNIPYFQDTTITEIYAAANGCDSVVTVEIMVNLVGTSRLDEEAYDFTVYPNPAERELYAEFQLAAQRGAVAIELLNGLGQLVSQPLPKAELAAGHYRIRIAVDQLPAGAYVLRLRTAKGSVFRQVVIL